MTKGIRALAARPGITAVAVATLALGFGVNAAIFSLTRTVLLRPLPYRDADRLALIGEASASRSIGYAPAVPANYVAWRSRARAFESTAGWRFVYFTLSGVTTPVRVEGLRVAPTFFPLLSVTPSLGRGFMDGEDRQGRRYLPYGQNPTHIMTLVARTSAGQQRPQEALPIMREAVRAADPNEPLFDEGSLDDVRRETFARSRELAWLIGSFAMLALVLSAIGVYGVMANVTTARSREIAIRIALGATRRDVIRLVVGDAMKLTSLGLVAGVLLAPVASRFAAASVFGVGTWNPLATLVVAVLLAAVSAGAAAVPAPRAARAAALSFR